MIQGGLRIKGNWSKESSPTRPIYSIVTVVFNDEKHIRATIESVLNQTYENIEYIVIDGHSRDGTIDIINEYEDQLAYWLSDKDEGLYDAMNRGLKHATGDFVWFMNSGDIIPTDTLVEEIVQDHFDAEIIYGETNYINEEGDVLGTRSKLTTRKLPPSLNSESFKMGMLVSHQSFIVLKKIAVPFNLTYKYSADIDWCIRCMKKAELIVNANRVLSHYLIAGISIQNQKASWRERFKISVIYYGYFTTLYNSILIVLRAIKFRLKTKKKFRVD